MAVLDHASTPAQLSKGAGDADEEATASLITAVIDKLLVVGIYELVVVSTDELFVMEADSLTMVDTYTVALVGSDAVMIAWLIIAVVDPPPRVPPAHALTIKIPISTKMDFKFSAHLLGDQSPLTLPVGTVAVHHLFYI